MLKTPIVPGKRGAQPTVAPAIALFLGGFALLNGLGECLRPGFDLNLWWVDLRSLPGWIAWPLVTLGGASLVAFSFVPGMGLWRSCLTFLTVSALAASSLFNAFTFYLLWMTNRIHPWAPIPFSLIVMAGLLWVLHHACRNSRFFNVAFVAGFQARPPRGARQHLLTVAGAGVLALLFALCQMVLFGKTDYRRPAQVAVVMGARVFADGRLSDALEDRVRTACDLYRQGLVRTLIMSGGPGDGLVHETAAMKAAAVGWGVPAENILVDEYGLNTEATVRNTTPLFGKLGASRILVVSHGYHLPRIKMAYQRASVEVYTVPARESYLLRQLPYNMAREAAALWVYYLRPLASR